MLQAEGKELAGGSRRSTSSMARPLAAPGGWVWFMNRSLLATRRREPGKMGQAGCPVHGWGPGRPGSGRAGEGCLRAVSQGECRNRAQPACMGVCWPCSCVFLQAGSRLHAPTADNRLPVDGGGLSDW
ncbi:hypothetical protein C3B79_2663 [Aeromonas hydrophila]|nr:hypothetical protein C3B79_2663 [Aeromonas hydrophila]